MFPMGGSQPHSPSLQSGIGRPGSFSLFSLAFLAELGHSGFPLIFCFALLRSFRVASDCFSALLAERLR